MGAGETSEDDCPVALRPLDSLFDFSDHTDIIEVVVQGFIFEDVLLRQQQNSAVGIIAERNVDSREGGVFRAEFHTENCMRKSHCPTQRDDWQIGEFGVFGFVVHFCSLSGH